MPYLPTEPLIPFLRNHIDISVMRRGLPASGVYRIAEEVSRITGVQVDSARKEIRHILRGQVHVIWDRTADAFAAALGEHPRDIWPDWEELTADGIPVGSLVCGLRLILAGARI